MTVYLVGAGPGDPELLTLRAARLLAAADVVLHDRLVGESTLALARPDALLIDVGKSTGSHTMAQSEINDLLVEHGSRAAVVVRLKGGDPFVFGRGGEEAQALLAAKVDIEVVPGITAAIAAPAAAGVPVTMRNQALAFTVVTGHADPNGPVTVDWAAHVATGATLVILMGVGRIGMIAEQLLAAGMAPSTPAVGVQWATTDRQRVTRTTVAELGAAGLASPCTIVVGDVAALDLRFDAMTLTFPIVPMKGVLGVLPPDDGGWSYEVKYDGYRTLSFVDGSRTVLQSTTLADVSKRWPELGALAGGVHAETAILDGELAVLDDRGRPRFELIQRHERQAVYFVFDVLQVDGHDTIGLPYEERRRLLAEIVEPGSNWSVPTHHIGDGAALLAATAAQELEGVMAKRLGSTYQPGGRTPNWRKIKNRIRVDVVIGGFTAGSGNRTSTFGAILVGRHDGDDLVFAGGVGSGFSQRTLESLGRRFAELRTDDCPFTPTPPREYVRNATWVRPELTATIEITEFTNDGVVRQASFVGLTE